MIYPSSEQLPLETHDMQYPVTPVCVFGTAGVFKLACTAPD